MKCNLWTESEFCMLDVNKTLSSSIKPNKFLLDSSENTFWYNVTQKELVFCPLS